jgi:hypothetical protein
VPPRPVRVIDTGLRSGRENVAFDQALIDAHNARRIPETVRFLRFRPAALVGLHQILSHEVRLERLLPRRLQTLRISGAAHYPMHQARNEVLAAAIKFIRSATGASTGTSSSLQSRQR